MNALRKHWQTICALLAIVGGLITATECWATDWPDPIGPTVNSSSVCNVQPGYCGTWDASCVNKGTPGWPNNWFQCGDNIWLSLIATDARAHGTCIGGIGSCTMCAF